MSLQQIAEDVWTLAGPLKFVGLHVGSRMTIVRLPSGKLWVHSPVGLDDEATESIRSLGEVDTVVAPNLYHHLYVGPCQEKLGGVLVAPAKLAAKRKDLQLDAEFGPSFSPPWGDTLQPIHVPTAMLDETVFLHKPSRTLISADLFENFDSSPHWWTRWYLKVGGIERGPGVSRLLRPLFRDRTKARAAIDQLLGAELQRITVAHGSMVLEDATENLRSAYTWLKA